MEHIVMNVDSMDIDPYTAEREAMDRRGQMQAQRMTERAARDAAPAEADLLAQGRVMGQFEGGRANEGPHPSGGGTAMIPVLDTHAEDALAGMRANGGASYGTVAIKGGEGIVSTTIHTITAIKMDPEGVAPEDGTEMEEVLEKANPFHAWRSHD